jgi:hypothetical protein
MGSGDWVTSLIESMSSWRRAWSSPGPEGVDVMVMVRVKRGGRRRRRRSEEVEKGAADSDDGPGYRYWYRPNRDFFDFFGICIGIGTGVGDIAHFAGDIAENCGRYRPPAGRKSEERGREELMQPAHQRRGTGIENNAKQCNAFVPYFGLLTLLRIAESAALQRQAPSPSRPSHDGNSPMTTPETLSSPLTLSLARLFSPILAALPLL